ncbi:uncharacterized protein [Rutidosis leptorrhynchoides]|uniref:uncharacterized protein n=1 Tax=Rutidosis leptorrhynchoides TaxID=125765 RepID=UPI003A9A639D
MNLINQQLIDLDILIDAGDENSKFYHCSLKHKRGVQNIQGLMLDGVWEVEPGTIKSKFYEFYKAKFDEHCSGATFSHVDPYYKLSVDEANFLEREVDDAEIKRDVWDCGSSKAPVQNPVLITDFRPISLVSFFYKIVSKILTKRLLPFIDKLISPVQSAFIAGRQILDGSMMLSEIISWFKKVNKKLLLFKVDFEKAFDSVNWEYLIFMLSSLGYGSIEIG